MNDANQINSDIDSLLKKQRALENRIDAILGKLSPICKELDDLKRGLTETTQAIERLKQTFVERRSREQDQPQKAPEKTIIVGGGKSGGGVVVPQQHFNRETTYTQQATQSIQNYSQHPPQAQANKTNSYEPAPSQTPVIRNLDPKEKTILRTIESMGFSKAVETYSSLKLTVPKNHQERLQGSSNEDVQFVTTTQPSPSYFAFEGNNGTYSVIPNLTLILPPLMIQQTGLDIIYEITPPKPSGPKKIKQILAPARMRFDGQRWSLLAKGLLSFEA